MKRFLLVNKSFFIRKGNSFEKVDAKPLSFGGQDLFLHKGKRFFYVVSEGHTGLRITKYHKTKKEALKQARKIIEEKNNVIDMKISEKIGFNNLSPRYRFVVNPTRII